MDNFNLKKYLAEGKLHENEYQFTDAGGNPITFEAFIGDFAAGAIPEGWDVGEDGPYEDEIEAFTSEEYDEDAVANYNAAYDILSKRPFTHIYDTGEVLYITALDNGNLKFLYSFKNDLREWQDKFNATIYNIDPKKWVDQKSFQDDLNLFVDEAIRASDLDLVQDIMNATKNVSEYASRSLRTYKNL